MKNKNNNKKKKQNKNKSTLSLLGQKLSICKYTKAK